MSKTLIAIPTAGGLHERTAAWYACMTRRSDVGLAIVTGRPHDYVRNAIVRQFLGDRLYASALWSTSDIEPPLDALDKLLELEVPLATGCYPLVGPHGPCWALANRDAAGHYPLLRRLPNKPAASLTPPAAAACSSIATSSTGSRLALVQMGRAPRRLPDG